MVWVVETPT